jgi:hypothetical protein
MALCLMERRGGQVVDQKACSERLILAPLQLEAIQASPQRALQE